MSGRFLLDQEDYDRLQAAIGPEVSFGEVLGKHSDVHGTLEEKDLFVITDDQEWLRKALDLGVDLDVGFNPLDYLDDDEEPCGDCDEEDEEEAS
jgi:hypothetical protein